MKIADMAERELLEILGPSRSIPTFDIPYNYFDGKEFENAIRKEYSWYKENLAKFQEKKK